MHLYQKTKKVNRLSDLCASRKEKLIKFFFPLYPLKLFRNTKLLVLLSFFIGLKLISGLASIWIPFVNTKFSFNFILTIIIGWNYGPIYSLLIGAISNNLSWIFSGTIWFWMYFISEPLAMFLAGIIGSIYRYRKNIKNTKNDLIFQQSLLVIMFLTCMAFVFYWGKSFLTNYDISTLLIISVSTLIGYMLLVETLFITIVKKHKNENDLEKRKLLIYSFSILTLNSMLFSFICGPIFAIEYLKYIHNGQTTPMYEKYGLLFYFVPRVIKEIIKFLIGFSLTIFLQTLTQHYMKMIERHHFLQWNK